jgi:hypothetical protein
VSDQSRPLPDQPNLRYVKMEAKRRLAAGEFATLHEAQLAIAREHGLPSWTALKRLIDAQTAPANDALAHVRWVFARFATADAPAWSAPDEEELRAHFDEQFLAAIGPSTVVDTLSPAAAQLRGELVVLTETTCGVRARIADLLVDAVSEADPPHRLAGMVVYPVGAPIRDPRVTSPSTRVVGDAPAAAVRALTECFADHGLVGLGAGGAAGHGAPAWAAACGWASLERTEELQAHHRFPAYSIT